MTLTVRSSSLTGATTAARALTHAEMDANWAHVIESSNQNFTPSGSGAVAESVQTAIRRFVHTDQYSSQGNYETARDALTGTIGVPNLDIAGDTLKIFAGTWTVGSDVVATRDAGTVATSTVDLWKYTASFEGHSGGGSLTYAFHVIGEHEGGNAINTASAGRFTGMQNGSGAITSLQALIAENRLDSAGNVGSAYGLTLAFHLTSTGGTTTDVQNIRISAPVITGSGTIPHIYGLRISNMGHANITTVSGVYVEDQTGASGGMYGVRTFISAGTDKYNINAAGTAVNFFQGNVGIGTGGPQVSAALSLPAGTTTVASLRLNHGVAPTSPVNGDMWTTTSGLFVRINGSTVGPLS
jgi:hypothetical protein